MAMLEKTVTVESQIDAAAVPGYQSYSSYALQFFDGFGNRGRRYAEHIGRSRNFARFGGSNKVFYLAQSDIHISL